MASAGPTTLSRSSVSRMDPTVRRVLVPSRFSANPVDRSSNAGHLVPGQLQMATDVGADESCATCYQNVHNYLRIALVPSASAPVT